jgi:DNA end-binding protein Ku
MRPLWSGAISFGLINIPVKLYSASKARPLNFKLLQKHSECEISFQRVCKKNHKEVPYEDIVKGYQIKPGEYVVLDDKDFEKAKADESREIDIVSFADEAEIDPKFYEKPYYLEPDKKAMKAYSLLREVLKQSNKVGIAKFVMRDKQHLAAVKTEDDVLVLNQLRFVDEIRPAKELGIPKKSDFSKKELGIAQRLVDQLTEKFKPEQFKDTYTDKMLEIIKAKAKGVKPKVQEEEDEPKGEVFDLMAALKASLEPGKKEKQTQKSKAKKKVRA